MRPGPFLLLPILALVLAGCFRTDAERGLAGAAVGAGTAAAIDSDVGTGAVLGGIAGVGCDNVGAC